MKKRPMFCLIINLMDKCVGLSCPCGWPENPCGKMYGMTDDPPEPGATFDGETWRS